MPTPLRLLLVEDSEDDAALLLRELRRGGFDVVFERVDTAAAMNAALDRQDWDLVVSDHSMPYFSGTDALRLLRERSTDLPFIFVSGTLGEDTAVRALKSGAQDYLMKNNLARLVPAIQRELEEVTQRRERVRLEQQVQQLQKFEAIGRLAGGIAHDFNNVLGAIMGWVELAQDDAQPGTRLKDRLEKIHDQAKRAAGLTGQLLAFARRQVLQPQKINLNVMAEEGTSLLRRVIGEHIEVRIVPTPDLRVTLADPAQIEQVLMNLCLNSRDAMPNGGKLTIETRNVDITQELVHQYSYSKPGAYVSLSVSDTGTGMDAATMERIFEPFFTTKELGRGTGLGLATVYGIVKQHGGFINVASQLGAGTTFRIFLPADNGGAESRSVEQVEALRKGSETILLAEDHDGLRESTQEILQGLGYRVIAASDGTAAVQQFKKYKDRIDLALLDIVMPGLTGPEAYQQMAAIRPGLPVILTTGYTSEVPALASMREAGAAILQKPYGPKSLSQIIGAVLDRKSVPEHSYH